MSTLASATHQSPVPGLMSRVKIYLSHTRAERQLQMLDDRMLADIGVNRNGIGAAVWGR